MTHDIAQNKRAQRPTSAAALRAALLDCQAVSAGLKISFARMSDGTVSRPKAANHPAR